MATQQRGDTAPGHLAALWSLAIAFLLLAASVLVAARLYASASGGRPSSVQCDGREVRSALLTHHLLTDTWDFECTAMPGGSKFQ